MRCGRGEKVDLTNARYGFRWRIWRYHRHQREAIDLGQKKLITYQNFAVNRFICTHPPNENEKLFTVEVYLFTVCKLKYLPD
jgi:hypothetical protein